MKNSSRSKAEGFEPSSDVVWGAAGIADEIGCDDPKKIYYLFSKGLLDGAVKKLWHKTYIGSRTRLRQLFFSE
jgi:hypothetical protein